MTSVPPVILTRASRAGSADLGGLASQLVSLNRLTIRRVRDSVRQGILPWHIWSGHSAVTASLIRGLEKSGTRFNFNPWQMPSSPPKSLGVLADLRALKWAGAYAKRTGGVELTVGPNVVVTPTHARALLEADFVRQVLVPSNIFVDFYSSELPSISTKLRVWMSGVDSDYWRPIHKQRSDLLGRPLILVYIKTTDRHRIASVRRLCERHGANVLTVQYGRYSPREYRDKLRLSDAVVVLGGAESQGIFMFEAWSVNVPTFVHAPTQLQIKAQGGPVRYYPGRVLASPYLTPSTGDFWTDDDDLARLVNNLHDTSYTPRDWVLSNARSDHSATTYIGLLTGVQ